MATAAFSSIPTRPELELSKLCAPSSSSSSSASTFLCNRAKYKNTVFFPSNRKFACRARPFQPFTSSASSAVLTESLAGITVEELQIGVSGRKYPIYIGSGILDRAETFKRDPDTSTYAIKRSCEIKSEILRLDREQGGLKDILNLGRIFALGIEKSMEPGEWLYGEALAVGIVMALDLSHRLEWIDDSVLTDAVVAMERAHLPTAPPAHISKETLEKNMDLPTSGHPRLSLVKGHAGNCIFTDDYDQRAFESMVTFFCLGDRV